MGLKTVLDSSALILSIVNGLMLLRFYLRDKPKLTVRPIHPETYQWWFRLPGGTHEGMKTRKYGFLIYVGIANSGLRKVSIESWRLYLKTRLFQQVELKPMSIPEPKARIGDSEQVKVYPVLGQRGLIFTGETLVDSGTNIAGMAYYVAEFHGDEGWNPRINDGKIAGKFLIKDVFGKKASCEVIFSEKPLDEIKSIIEDVDKDR